MNAFRDSRCSLCYSAVTKVEIKATAHHRAIFGDTPFEYRRCVACRFIFLHPQPTLEQLSLNYRALEAHRLMETPPSFSAIAPKASRLRSMWRDMLHPEDRAYARIITHGRVLDLGCGSGDLVSSLLARGVAAEGVDFDEAAVALARSRGLPVTHSNFEDLTLEHEVYDYIVLQHVLEHIVNPVAFLSRIKDALKPTGRIVVEVPNVGSLTQSVFGPHWNGWDPPWHVNQFTKQSLRRALWLAGFLHPEISTLSSVEEFRRSWNLRRNTGKRLTFIRILLLPIYWAIAAIGRGGVILAHAPSIPPGMLPRIKRDEDVQLGSEM